MRKGRSRKHIFYEKQKESAIPVCSLFVTCTNSDSITETVVAEPVAQNGSRSSSACGIGQLQHPDVRFIFVHDIVKQSAVAANERAAWFAV